MYFNRLFKFKIIGSIGVMPERNTDILLNTYLFQRVF